MTIILRFVSMTIFLLLLGSQNLVGQVEGCTDPRANNYNALATKNDGSCTYEATTIKPREVRKQLPSILLENSGMAELNGLLWFHNDSGGEPELYGYDSITNQVVATLRISNAVNVDWEDISQDNQFIYIGDFGNNSGTRNDLTIYKIPNASFPDSGSITTTAELLQFSYPDQVVFRPRSNNHNFDCEAFISCGDSLYLFSKNWENEWTKLYRLPKVAGLFEAELIDSFHINGLVTGADYNKDNHEVVLLGYQNYLPFFCLLFDFEDIRFFSGNKRRIDFKPTLLGSQTEGILYHKNKGFYISTEKSPLVTNKLMEVCSWPWTMPMNTSIQESDSSELIIYPNPSQGRFRIVLPKETSLVVHVHFIDSSGRVVFEIKNELALIDNTFEIDTENLADGQYFMIIKTDFKIYRKSIHLIN